MNINDWLDNWEREADNFFRKLDNVPPELEGEVNKLINWKEQARHAADQYAAIRERLWIQRMEQRDTQARIKLISQKQSKQVEQEISERELAKWQRKLENIKSQIDRITDHIIREMRRRNRQKVIEAAVWKASEAAALRRQAEADLAMWEKFKLTLEAKPKEPDPAELQNAEELARQRAERDYFRRQYQDYQSRPDPNTDEDHAAWQDFIGGLD